MFERRTQRISRALIRQHLEDSDDEGDVDQDTTDDGLQDKTNFRFEPQDRYLPRCASAENLLGCKAWLDQLCDHEEGQLHETLEADSESSAGCGTGHLFGATQCDNLGPDSAIEHTCTDIAVLQRIRDGRGPREKAFEDLLTPLRDSKFNGAETYDEMRKVLQNWNKRMTGDQGENQYARAMLKVAVERRAELLKGPNDGFDKNHALDESSIELLQALTALRPEIAGFKNQEHFDVLVMMWANVRIAIPDMDDDLKVLTMKALINEVEHKSHTTNARKLSDMARSMSVARLESDMAEVERLEAKMKAFEGKMRETVVKRLIDRIKVARRDLMQVKLEELQKLTELQATQKRVAHTKLSATASWGNQDRACDQADGKQQRVLQQQVPELEAHVHVVQSNAQVLSDMSRSLLSRAVEAGFSLKDESTSAFVGLEESELKTYLTGSLADILYAQEQAAKMLDRMYTVEGHLGVMMDAARKQYREYDGLLRLLNPAGSLSTVGDAEVELAEKYGRRRESILLAARNMQRARNKQTT